ncbi:MAG: preprotein translocase subunit SecE [Candidatus Taylorbacteria bacterium RIFCSPHIGHO2_01_FULL_45_63]|uniref:Protein translocase subunit SecE n=1 Tax=Candidatus Taylorbacteria bacterium RIFCSPHIGHO2_02_FULL_45_35 TaxID=1802311 RepID=A0A1G2MS26_9BACT|nr:MAG: preprotein translocase subunit SecE [Candidatus Taylorbacteria bacterium RIFCSPHIGHO2_01_FULL_45_63]OHA25811.1 MAG: preprotein translocase subunit SecE [Candidatus Taylorbacteria bacterium RIFCSPHIGHO2_02_FULL_45_35]OHA34355.1 MAG: preprotein translocase subunit SecE [Candidatus Taylorbacteria bacterium RIFCSPLOWO2_01_FULL_45_34b]
MTVSEYIKETRGELKHVSWPTRKQAMTYTVIVIIVSLLTAAFLGFFDFLFSLGIQELLTKFIS